MLTPILCLVGVVGGNVIIIASIVFYERYINPWNSQRTVHETLTLTARASYTTII